MWVAICATQLLDCTRTWSSSDDETKMMLDVNLFHVKNKALLMEPFGHSGNYRAMQTSAVARRLSYIEKVKQSSSDWSTGSPEWRSNTLPSASTVPDAPTEYIVSYHRQT